MVWGQGQGCCAGPQRVPAPSCGCSDEDLGCSPALGMSLSACGQHSAQHVRASLSPGTCHVEGMEEPKNPNFTIKISIISKHPCDADPSLPAWYFLTLRSWQQTLGSSVGTCPAVPSRRLSPASSPRAGRAASRGKARSCLLLSIASLGHGLSERPGARSHTHQPACSCRARQHCPE